MDEPKTIFPEEAILFQSWSVATVGVTAGAGVLAVLQADNRMAISSNTNKTGRAFIVSLLVDESLQTKKDWMMCSTFVN
jgi:hypothetical protein